MKIGERVRLIRESKNISQAELAQAIHISNSLMNRLEKGTSTMSIQYVIDIAHALDVTPQDILCDIFVYNQITTTADEIKMVAEKLPPRYQSLALTILNALISNIDEL